MRTPLSLLIQESTSRLWASTPERDLLDCDDCRPADLWRWLDEQQNQVVASQHAEQA